MVQGHEFQQLFRDQLALPLSRDYHLAFAQPVIQPDAGAAWLLVLRRACRRRLILTLGITHMTRKLIPPTDVDRLGAVGIVLAASFGARLIVDGTYLLASIVLCLAVLLAYLVYWNQTPGSAQIQQDVYLDTIKRVDELKATLSYLGTFLENERQRVASVKATVAQLNEQHQRLEPIVAAQKQTVEAILSAYTTQQVRDIWKERALSFLLGVVASVIASFVYEAIKR